MCFMSLALPGLKRRELINASTRCEREQGEGSGFARPETKRALQIKEDNSTR